MSVATPTAEPSGGSRASSRLTPRAAVLAVLLTALLFYLIVPLRTYVEQRDRMGQLERQTQMLEQQNTRLLQQIRQLNDPDYIERIARECLGMVRPGEIGFVVAPRKGTPRPPAC